MQLLLFLSNVKYKIDFTETGGNSKYQIHLKSDSGQISVLLVDKEANSDPVVVQVKGRGNSILSVLGMERGGMD